MKHRGSCIVGLLAIGLLFGLPGLAKSKSPIGIWETIDDNTNQAKSHVEIFEKDKKLYGKIVKLLQDPEDTVCKVCKGERKDKKVLGMTIMWDMVQDGDEWEDGEILDPDNGKIYDCKIWREGDKLKVRGYVAFFFRTQTWNLVSEK